MSTENPYVAPLAVDDDRPLPANAHDLLALRQRLVYRETTLRAWGLAKLILGALLLGWSLIDYSINLLNGAPTEPTIDLLEGLGQQIAYFLVPSLGFLYLQSWSRWWQLALGIWLALFVVSMWNDESQVFAGVFFLTLNGSLIYLVTSNSTRKVLSRRYRSACRITTLHGVSLPLLTKLIAFLIVEATLIATIVFIGQNSVVALP